MLTVKAEKDAFRVDSGMKGKRRLIRCKGQTQEKRQCWQLTDGELKGLYLTLHRYFSQSEGSPTVLADLSEVTSLMELMDTTKDALLEYGNMDITFKVHLDP